MSPGSRSPELEMRPSHKSRSTLMNLSETELENRLQTISDGPQMDLLIGERHRVVSAQRDEKRYLKEELLERQRLELCECEMIEDSRSEGEGSKRGVRNGRLRRQSGALGRKGALTGEKLGRGKEGKRGTRTKIQKFQEQSGRGPLLPGIPDDITLDLITTKLSWTDMHLLPSISHAWKDAVCSRQVYRARVQAHATESLYARPGCYWPRMPNMAIAIYSNILPPKPGSFERPSKIPKVPKKKGGFRSTDGFFYLNGKIYATGCLIKRSVISRIFVFDMGGKSQWTECASRKLSAKPPSFPHSVSYDLHSGRIVLKGASGNYEIYDPEFNSWFSTTDLPVPGPHCEHSLNCSSPECLRGFKIFIIPFSSTPLSSLNEFASSCLLEKGRDN